MVVEDVRSACMACFDDHAYDINVDGIEIMKLTVAEAHLLARLRMTGMRKVDAKSEGYSLAGQVFSSTLNVSMQVSNPASEIKRRYNAVERIITSQPHRTLDNQGCHNHYSIGHRVCHRVDLHAGQF